MFVCAAGIRQPPTTCYPLSLFLEKGSTRKAEQRADGISQEMAASCHFRANSNSCSLSETELRQSKNLNEYAENKNNKQATFFKPVQNARHVQLGVSLCEKLSPATFTKCRIALLTELTLSHLIYQRAHLQTGEAHLCKYALRGKKKKSVQTCSPKRISIKSNIHLACFWIASFSISAVSTALQKLCYLETTTAQLSRPVRTLSQCVDFQYPKLCNIIAEAPLNHFILQPHALGCSRLEIFLQVETAVGFDVPLVILCLFGIVPMSEVTNQSFGLMTDLRTCPVDSL